MKLKTRVRKLVKDNLPKSSIERIRNFRNKNGRIKDLEDNLHRLFNSQYLDTKDKKELFKSKEFKVFSQNGEDGLLLYIFSKIGVKNKTFVEFGVGDGRECITANLSFNHGWTGLLMESDFEDYKRVKEYYKDLPVSVEYETVTKENINGLLKSYLQELNELDLLVIDIDSTDYHIWKEIKIKPRVVVVEYNASFGDNKSLTVPYKKDFQRLHGFYHGASLTAFYKLAIRKDYSLIGCDSTGCNAFFVRDDLLSMEFMTPKEAYYPHIRRLKNETTKEQFNKIKHLKFDKV